MPGATATRDRHALYEACVLDCANQLRELERIVRRRDAPAPLRLREDFCGTARLSAEWVRSAPDRRALAIDLDPDVLAWADAHNRAPLGAAADRLELRCDDVREAPRGEGADLVVVNNLSYCVFHERAMLLRYFASVRQALAEGGALVLDVHTGPDAQYVAQFHVEMPGYTYVWEQRSFDPLSNRRRCEIHFLFDDGEELRAAFRYDWRLWSVPELVDLLGEAGFREVEPRIVDSVRRLRDARAADPLRSTSSGRAADPLRSTSSERVADLPGVVSGERGAFESLYLYLVAWR